MKNKINQFYNDIFDEKKKTLLLPKTRLFFSVKKDGQYNGSFLIKSGDNRPVRGIVYATDYRVHIRESGFDSEEIKISFTYDATGLTPGRLSKGRFVIVSEAGEYEIHFTTLVEVPYIDTSFGRVTNLEEFTKLAAYNYTEATALFASTRFREVIDGEKEEIRTFYEGLRKLSLNQSALEEFLIGTGMKDPIRVDVGDRQRNYEGVTRTQTDFLEITKDTWGYLPVTIETQGDFLRADRDRISSMEFVGNRFELEYMVLRERLHDGRNFGCIRVITPYETIRVDVEAYAAALTSEEVERLQKNKKQQLEMLKAYFDVRCRKRTVRQWADEYLPVLDSLVQNEEDPTDSFIPLVKAHMLLDSGRKDEAGLILEDYDKKRWPRTRQADLHGYYLYLSARFKGELAYTLRIVDEVRRLYDRNEESWALLWVLLQSEESLIQNAERRLQVITNQWENGKFNCFLYLEAYLTLLEQPGLIDLSDPFIIHTLLFAEHRELLTKEVASSLALAVTRQREFHAHLFTVLRSCYRLFPSRDLLSAVCRYLIMGHCTKKEYFPWYEKGVEEGLHIARLYEYYLYSAGDERNVRLPEAIFLYFSHQNELSAEKKAFLYANLIRHVEEYPEIYENNRTQMESFTREQLLEGKISSNLRILYRHFLPGIERTGEVNQALADILFTYDIHVDDPDLRQVIVLHSKLNRPVTVPLMNGRAQIRVYTKKDRILLRSARGYVYADTIDYDMTRLFPEDRYLDLLSKENCTHLAIALSACEDERITPESAFFQEFLSSNDEVRDRIKKEIRCRLLFYFFAEEQANKVKQYLPLVEDIRLGANDRSSLIGIYLSQNQIKRAYEVIKKYGFEEMDLRYLAQLCSRYIREEFYRENPLLLAAGYECFIRHQYDETILSFLIDFYNGRTKDMCHLWEAATERKCRTSKLEERILTQMLFTEDVLGEDEIFYQYYINGGSERIRRAYLSYKSYGYYVRNQILSDRFFEYIETEYAHEQKMNISEKLATLKYYADKEPQEQLIRTMLADFLDDCLSEGYFFTYFQNGGERAQSILRKYLLHNRILVQYQTTNRAKVSISYIITKDSEASGTYRSEIMRQVYQTYYVSEFVLFSGEELHYYITEDGEDKSTVAEVGIIRQQDTGEEAGRLYEINRILGEPHPEVLLDEYERKNYMTGQMFQTL